MYVYPFQIVFPIVSELLVSIQTHSSWKRLSEGPQNEERRRRERKKNTFLYCVFSSVRRGGPYRKRPLSHYIWEMYRETS